MTVGPSIDHRGASRFAIDDRGASRFAIDDRGASRFAIDDRGASRFAIDDRGASRFAIDDRGASRFAIDDRGASRFAIELDHVFRRYGAVLAVADVSLAVQAGEVYGLLGPNGAGKTTLLRILSTLLSPTGGTARVLGHDVSTEPEKVRQCIGVLTAGSGLYDRLTPRETLRYFLRLHGQGRKDASDRADAAVRRFRLESFADRHCAGLSTGQRQRVLLARAMVHDPQVLMLDEPTSGLDVLAARSIHELVDEARAAHKAVLLSSHDMLEVELLCDRIGILSGGRLRAEGTMADLKERSGKQKLAQVFLSYLDPLSGEAA